MPVVQPRPGTVRSVKAKVLATFGAVAILTGDRRATFSFALNLVTLIDVDGESDRTILFGDGVGRRPCRVADENLRWSDPSCSCGFVPCGRSVGDNDLHRYSSFYRDEPSGL